MAIYDYLTTDEALSLIQKNINIIDECNLSAKRLLEDYIEIGEIFPLFKFNGFIVSYKYYNFKAGKGSVELKQISKVQGYFYDGSVLYDSEYNTHVFCSDLDRNLYEISRAVPADISSNMFISTSYTIHEVKNDILEKYHGKETYRETFNLELYEEVSLFKFMPNIINSKLVVEDQKMPVQITKREIYFKVVDIQGLINTLPKTNTNNDIENQLIEAQAKIAELESELAQVKAKLVEKTDNLANVEIDEGQGDTLLILGAVMDCIKEVAKPNYTQGLLITAITDKYENTSSLTYSTLSKKFPKAKNHLKQNVTP